MGLAENIIKNLDKTELRYIAKDLLRDKDSQAKKLFELIEEFGEDEEKIAARFRRAAPKGNLAVVRNQLQQILLTGVEQLHGGNYAFAEVNSLITQIQIFNDRSAFDIVRKLLDRALRLAQENELFTQWIELLGIKLHLYQTKSYGEEEKIDDLIQSYHAVVAMHFNYTQYRGLAFDQMQLTNSNYLLRSEDTKAKWEKIDHHELLQSIDRAQSKRAQIEYWIIKVQYRLIFYHYDEAKIYFGELIKLLEDTPFLRRAKAMNYLWAYAQLAHIGYFQRDTSLMRSALDTLQQTPRYSPLEEVAAFTFHTNYAIAYYDLTNDQPALNQLIHDAYAGLKKWAPQIKPDARMALLVSSVSVWAEQGEYEKVLKVIHEFAEYIYTENRLDGKIVLLFYQLIAQIESGNELMVNDTLQNFNRYLLRHDFKREFEQLMVRFLKIISSGSIRIKEELAALKEQLLQLPDKSILDQHPVLYQILMTMIDSKLAGQKYHDYMQSLKSQ